VGVEGFEEMKLDVHDKALAAFAAKAPLTAAAGREFRYRRRSLQAVTTSRWLGRARWCR